MLARYVRLSRFVPPIVTTLVLTAGWPLATQGQSTQPPPSSEPRPTRTVTVGRATLHWHLGSEPAVQSPGQQSSQQQSSGQGQPGSPAEAGAVAAQRAALVAAFREATAAHLTSAEPYVTRVDLATQGANQNVVPLPAELIHAMFVGPDGKDYCSDSTVTRTATSQKATSANSGIENER